MAAYPLTAARNAALSGVGPMAVSRPHSRPNGPQTAEHRARRNWYPKLVPGPPETPIRPGTSARIAKRDTGIESGLGGLLSSYRQCFQAFRCSRMRWDRLELRQYCDNGLRRTRPRPRLRGRRGSAETRGYPCGPSTSGGVTLARRRRPSGCRTALAFPTRFPVSDGGRPETAGKYRDSTRWMIHRDRG
jgi:hypothetical protein